MLAATDDKLSVGDYEDASSEAADKCHMCDSSGNHIISGSCVMCNGKPVPGVWAAGDLWGGML